MGGCLRAEMGGVMKIMLVGVVASSEIGGRALKFTPEGEAAKV